MFGNKLFGEEKVKIAYKLLHDLFFLLLIFFILALIADGLLPGIVSSHVGFYKIILAILFVIFSINLASKKTRAITNLALNEKINQVIYFILAALIFNGMLNIGLPINISILVLVMALLYLSANIFFNTKN